MIFINVVGGNKQKRHKAEELVHFALKKLLPRIRKIDITLEIRRYKKDEDCLLGECFHVGKADFLIDINSDIPLDDEEFALTIFHEMTHVKQFHRGELKESYKCYRNLLWKGKDFSHELVEVNKPWEIEARSTEIVLFEEFHK